MNAVSKNSDDTYCQNWPKTGQIKPNMKTRPEKRLPQSRAGRAGAVFEVTGVFGQEQYGQNPHKRRKSSVMDGRMDGLTKRVVDSARD